MADIPAPPTSQSQFFVPAVPDHVLFVPITPEQNELDSDITSNVENEQAIRDDQAKNAHYSFDSSVQDTINDHAHTRQETR